MQGDKQVIADLNAALKKELGAINQYFLHARMLDDWGVTKLGKHEYNESIEEMKHAEELIDRILFLGGLPNLQEVGKLHIGENVKEILECDLKIEVEGVVAYKKAIAHARDVQDFVTEDLFKKILTDEEGHVDYLETQLELIEQIGIENYIQLNSESPLDAEAGS
ncbi:MAG: bacterioferritin [Bdellovibrionales bacterium]